jgi:hypothetical protein
VIQLGMKNGEMVVVVVLHLVSLWEGDGSDVTA